MINNSLVVHIFPLFSYLCKENGSRDLLRCGKTEVDTFLGRKSFRQSAKRVNNNNANVEFNIKLLMSFKQTNTAK